MITLKEKLDCIQTMEHLAQELMERKIEEEPIIIDHETYKALQAIIKFVIQGMITSILEEFPKGGTVL